MKEKTKAFLAGLLDSEGSVSIGRHYSKERTYVVKGKSYTYKGYTSYGVEVAVYNTYRPLMKYLVKHFGGTFRVLKKETNKRQTVYAWKPEAAGHTQEVLNLVMPYMLLKKLQAEICIKFLEIVGTDPERRNSVFEEYKKVESNSVTTDTNHVLSWKPNLQNAYFSAIFDGEGTASVYNSSTIWITNSNRNILENAKFLYQGNNITGGYRKGAKKERLPEFRVAIPVDTMEKFILKIVPYSIIKREQLLLTLEHLRGCPKERTETIKKSLFELKHPLSAKIQSGLIGNNESALMETLEAV